MNLLLIDKEFKKLNRVEDYINYKFEPRSKNLKGKRHIYYNDLRNDFIDEVNAYGFSPFIQETYDNQRKDKNIMKYKTNYLNQGLLNYVKKRHITSGIETNKPKIIDYKINGLSKGYKSDRKQKSAMSSRNYLKYKNEVEELNSPKDNDQEENKQQTKENFLQKALENLARNKLNLSEDSNIFSNEKDKRKDISIRDNSISKSKRGITSNRNDEEMAQLKMNYINSLHYKVDLNPLISISNFSQPEPLKLNFERFFSNIKKIRKTADSKLELKKVVGLFKNKDIVTNFKSNNYKENFGIQNNQQDEHFYERVNMNEIVRDKVDLKGSLNILTNKPVNVFKKLYSQSKIKKEKIKKVTMSMHNANDIQKIESKILSDRINKDYLNEELSHKIIEKSPHSLLKKVTLQKLKKQNK